MTIQELREKLQSEKFPLRSHYWGYNWLYRKPSIYITYLLSKTEVTANEVSGVVLACGLIGSIFALGGYAYLAIFFAYLNILLDGVDGEMARLRNTFSLRGVYLDAINHLAVPAVFFFSLAAGIADGVLFTFVTGLGALSWSLLKAAGKLENKIFFGAYLGNETKFNKIKSRNLADSQPNKSGWIKEVVGSRYQFREFLIGLIIFLFAHVLNILPDVIFIYSIFLISQCLEEIYRGYFTIESRVTSLAKQNAEGKGNV